MDWIAFGTIVLLFAAFAAFLVSLFMRMKPGAGRAKKVFYILGIAAFAAFVLWGISRNF